MKSALVAVCLLVLGLPAYSQDVPPSAPPAAAPSPPAPAADPASVAQAEKLLDEVAAAYKKAAAFTDTLKMEVESPGGNQEQEMQIAVSGSDSRLVLPGLALTAVGGKLYVVRDDLASKYFVTDLKEGMGKSLKELFGDGAFTPPQLALREATEQRPGVDALIMGIMQNARITGHKMNADDAGKSLHEVSVAGDEGTGSILINPQTKFLEKIRLQLSPPQAPPGFDVKITMSMDPKAHESLPEAIAFDAGERRGVDSLDKLVAVAVGDTPPDFTLQTLNGETVTLSNLKGSAVVLDFWATWCRPCRAVLPKLQQFSTWAEGSGQPVRVFALNTLERSSTPEETKTKVSQFWTNEKFTMPVLLDLDNAVATKYQVASIPMTVVVGPDGKIFKIHQGFDPNVDFVEELKKEVNEALKAGGAEAG